MSLVLGDRGQTLCFITLDGPMGCFVYAMFLHSLSTYVCSAIMILRLKSHDLSHLADLTSLSSQGINSVGSSHPVGNYCLGLGQPTSVQHQCPSYIVTSRSTCRAGSQSVTESIVWLLRFSLVIALCAVWYRGVCCTTCNCHI